jgi:hypothetical protein
MSNTGPRLGYLQNLLIGGAWDGATRPAGTNIKNVKKLKRNDSRGPLENTTRGCGGFKQFANGLRETSLSFTMNYDATDAAGFVALQTAYDAGTAVIAYANDGAASTKGIAGQFMVAKFDGIEENDQIVEVEVELRPDFNAAHPPLDF